MPEYRRFYRNGGTYFFTVVTNRRLPLFRENSTIDLLNQCFQTTLTRYPFKIEAMVILPDHLHTIWTLPENDADFSIRWQRIKGTFSRHYQHRRKTDVSESIVLKGERGIWQRRFWEHLVRDQADFNRLCDYIHYNPVKHGLVRSPAEWEHSSFRRFVEIGKYELDWGQSAIAELKEIELE